MASPLPLRIGLDDVGDSFDDRIASRGRRYFVEGRVRSVSQVDDYVTAKVEGSEPKPYTVRLSIDRHSLMPITTSCSCPYGSQCKHGAALAYAIATSDLQEALAVASALATQPAPTVPPRSHLPAHLRDWIESVGNTGARDRPDAVMPDSKRRLFYVVSIEHTRNVPRAVVRLINRSVLKSGGFGVEQPYALTGPIGGTFQKHINPFDRALITDLVHNGIHDYSRPEWVALEERHGSRLLDEIVASGRAHWESVESRPMTHADVRSTELTWHTDKLGNQLPVPSFPGHVKVIPVSPPRYIDRQTGAYGPVLCCDKPDLLVALLMSPPVPAEHGELVRHRLADLGVPESMLPAPSMPVEQLKVEPVVHISVEIEMCQPGLYARKLNQTPVPFLRLAFDYAGTRVRASDKEEIRTASNGMVHVIARDKQAEDNAVAEIGRLGWFRAQYMSETKPPQGRGTDFCLGNDGRRRFANLRQFDNFLQNEVPRLRELGWVVDTSGTIAYARPDDIEWQVGIEGGEQSNWFEFKLGIRIGNQSFDLRTILPQLLATEAQPKQTWGTPAKPTDDLCVNLGTMLAIIPRSRVVALIAPLRELFGDIADWPDDLILPKARLPEIDGIADAIGDAGAVWRTSEALAALRERLRNFDGLTPASEPTGFSGELRDYQRHGLAWLQFLSSFEFAGILADDMGLGKTVQVLAHIQAQKNAGRLDRPCLVVAPTSTLPNWQREAAHFAPGLRVVKLQGIARKTEYEMLTGADIALTNYATLARDRTELIASEFHLVVLDEAQNIKNAATASAKVARELKSRHRLALSGTPVENHLGELWSLFHFLMPGFLGSQQAFRKEFRVPIEQRGDAAAAARLDRRIRPFMLRRTKQQVATELPPITEIVETVEFGDKQRDLYESVRLAMDEKVRQLLANKGLNQSRVQILDALLKLRQVCCDPRLVKLEAARSVPDSAKLERLREMLAVLLEEGRKVLLFSQFTSMLNLIEPMLREMSVEWVRISGDTVDRDTPVRRFQNGEIPIFLISLKAGGTGLNLVAADTVIHYDPWWNPAVERQATDRAHRIGQDKPVMAYKLVAAGTVEEKILELQSRKGALADRVLAGAEDAASALRQEDLTWLFESG